MISNTRGDKNKSYTKSPPNWALIRSGIVSVLRCKTQYGHKLPSQPAGIQRMFCIAIAGSKPWQ